MLPGINYHSRDPQFSHLSDSLLIPQIQPRPSRDDDDSTDEWNWYYFQNQSIIKALYSEVQRPLHSHTVCTWTQLNTVHFAVSSTLGWSIIIKHSAALGRSCTLAGAIIMHSAAVSAA